MSAVEMVKLIGAQGMLSVHPLHVPVQVRDIKKAFGRVDLLVSPVGGKGEQWVSSERVKIPNFCTT